MSTAASPDKESCSICRAAVEPKQDVVALNGSCGHRVHLVCYETRKAGGVLGCCGSGSAVLGEVLRARLFNPLDTAASERQELATASTWRGRLQAVSRAFDTSVDGAPLMGLRARESVRVMLSRGFDAEALVRADNNRRQLVPLLGQYSVADLRALGFTWRALVGAGLTAETWDRRAMPIADLVLHMQLSAELVLETLCTSPEDLPNVRLDPPEWRALVGAKGTPSEFFLRSGMPGACLGRFGYSMEAWAQVMGLERPVADFNLTPDEAEAFIEATATAEDGSGEAEFRFHFPKDKLPPPNGDNGGGRAGMGRGRARSKPVRLGPGAAHVRRGAGARGARGARGGRAHALVDQTKARKDAKTRLNMVSLDLP